MIIPIGTDVRTRRPPLANWILIGLNVAIFLFTDWLGGPLGSALKARFTLDGARPVLFQYLTYQFLHGDLLHLAGNMLFLFIFGDAVCDRMGSLCYTMFYLAGGVCAGVVFASVAENPILGASGAIASVTTAFLVLFPRVRVMLLWVLVVITTFQVPAMYLIVFKIILWDNVLAPSLEAGAMSNVAYSAHLGGYAFGFLVAALMLATQALPRNQFDLLALWSRWRRRSGLPGIALESGPRLSRSIPSQEMDSRPLEPLRLTPIEQLREDILDRLSAQDFTEALRLHDQLMQLDSQVVLPRPQQLELANYLAQVQAHPRAVQAYESFLAAYPTAADADQVRLLVGLIYNRQLASPERAAAHLRLALAGLTLESQRRLAQDELRVAEARLGRGTA